MRSMQISFLIKMTLGLLLVFSACKNNPASVKDSLVENKAEDSIPLLPNPFPYSLDAPDQLIELPEELHEVSGLSFYETGVLCMLQDENGMIYLFDLEKEKVTLHIPFGKNGDYEGIERVGEKIYALQSDGDVFEIQHFLKDKAESKKFETRISKENDTEGLAYDSLNHQLWISCKASPNLEEKKYSGNRAVYAFDLYADTLLAEPILLINRDSLKAYFQRQMKKGEIWPEEKITFNPSAIAFHPLNGEIYVLASTGKLLVSVNRKGEIRKAFHLNPDIFKHPEGICFLPDGTLFISNEGDAGAPNLLKFLHQ